MQVLAPISEELIVKEHSPRKGFATPAPREIAAKFLRLRWTNSGG